MQTLQLSRTAIQQHTANLLHCYTPGDQFRCLQSTISVMWNHIYITWCAVKKCLKDIRQTLCNSLPNHVAYWQKPTLESSFSERFKAPACTLSSLHLSFNAELLDPSSVHLGQWSIHELNISTILLESFTLPTFPDKWSYREQSISAVSI